MKTIKNFKKEVLVKELSKKNQTKLYFFDKSRIIEEKSSEEIE